MTQTKKEGDQGALEGESSPGDPAAYARTVLRPTVQAAATLKEYGNLYSNLELSELVEALGEQTRASNEGDTARAEAMLTAQAHTLDAIFNNLARRAANAEYMDHLDHFLKLALRAQSQCRATWEAVASIKNPPVMGYVRQANIAHGPQQVNNGVREGPAAADEELNSFSQTKVLEEKDGQWLDPGETGATGKADQAMAALGEVDGPEDRSG